MANTQADVISAGFTQFLAFAGENMTLYRYSTAETYTSEEGYLVTRTEPVGVSFEGRISTTTQKDIQNAELNQIAVGDHTLYCFSSVDVRVRDKVTRGDSERYEVVSHAHRGQIENQLIFDKYMLKRRVNVAES